MVRSLLAARRGIDLHSTTTTITDTLMHLAEKITEPVVFEALASMRGDIANESVQHSELATSINRDVLEPLIRQRDSSEAINKIVSKACFCAPSPTQSSRAHFHYVVRVLTCAAIPAMPFHCSPRRRSASPRI